MRLRHLWLPLVTIFLASALTACSGGNTGSFPTVQDTVPVPTAAQQQNASRATLSVNAATESYTAIHAAGRAIGNWIADTDYSGGSVAGYNSTIDTSHVSDPAPQSVYHTMRWGKTLTYTIPHLTPDGAYTVRLHFVESTFNSARRRVFGVRVNDVQALTDLDIFAAAGGFHKAIVKEVSSKADASGKITIAFRASVNDASISGLEIIAATTASINPLCVKGTNYSTTEDDEFQNDTSLSYTSNASPVGTGKKWSTQFFYGTRIAPSSSDTAYYTDPNQGFGGYNPFTFEKDNDGGRSLHITAEPVPSQYLGSSQLNGQTWLSGTLQGAPQTYGYVEINAEIGSDVQGFHPAALWLQTTAGNVNTAPTPDLVEADVQESYGGASDPNAPGPKLNQDHATLHSGYNNDENLGGWMTASSSIVTNFHTFGILWTPTYAELYLDRIPRKLWSGAPLQFPTQSLGPMVPIMINSVWDGTEQGGLKPLGSPESINVRYFRWYQSNGTSCGSSVIN